jgi:hypothetical protein
MISNDSNATTETTSTTRTFYPVARRPKGTLKETMQEKTEK